MTTLEAQALEAIIRISKTLTNINENLMIIAANLESEKAEVKNDNNWKIF